MVILGLSHLLILLISFLTMVLCKTIDMVDSVACRNKFDNVRLNNRFIAKRETNPEVSDSGLVVINKCCAWGSYFDPNELVCKRKRKLMTSDDLSMEMTNFVLLHVKNLESRHVFNIKIPNCTKSEVLVNEIISSFAVDGNDHSAVSEFCIDDSDGHENTLLLTCQASWKVCGARHCIRKCRPYGEFLGDHSGKVPDVLSIKPDFYNLDNLKRNHSVTIADFGVYFGHKCGSKGLHRSIFDPPMDEFYLGTNGSLYFIKPEKVFHPADEFCIEYFKDGNETDVSVFTCANSPVKSFLKYHLLSAGFVISCICLLATFLVYCCSPRSQNLYGKSLMCYVASLFFAYLNLTFTNLIITESTPKACTIAGYTLLFFFLGAFFWLNSMSIDIWKTFRSVRPTRINNAGKEKIKFAWYSLYSWSLTCALTGLCLAADFIPGFVSQNFKPDIGMNSCWFSKQTKAILIFFITPISIIIACNTVLYVNTAWRCWKIKSNIVRMGNQNRKKYLTNKTQLLISGKLFIVMGVVWSMEVISFFFDHPILYISDALNALHGLLIFIIFVLKKQMLSSLRERIKSPFTRKKSIRRKSLDKLGPRDDISANIRTFCSSPSTHETEIFEKKVMPAES